MQPVSRGSLEPCFKIGGVGGNNGREPKGGAHSTQCTFVRGDFVLVFRPAGELQEVLDQVQGDERLTEHQPADGTRDTACHCAATVTASRSGDTQAHSHFVLHLLGHAEDLKEEHDLPRVLQDLGVGLGDKLLVPVGGGAPWCGAGGLSRFGGAQKVTD